LDLWLKYLWLLIFTYVGPVATISVNFNIYACWTCDYNIRETSKYLPMYIGHVTTLSVTSKCLRMLDMWLQYLWRRNSYVCWTCDYNIRETSKYLHKYIRLVTTLSVTFKYLRMLDIWLQYPWHLNIYLCWTCDYNIRDI
jgi:hypothetical protein